jgi:membrane protein implicated in regulation of membrane protease activity
VRRLRWDSSERKIPAHPYRDSALLYGFLAALVVVVSVATGGDVVRAAVVAVVAFVIATAFSWWRWRARIQRQEERPE